MTKWKLPGGYEIRKKKKKKRFAKLKRTRSAIKGFNTIFR